MKHLKINVYSVVLSLIGLSNAETTCVYLCITVVDSPIALGPADGASFCLLPELPALRIRTVLQSSARHLFCSSTA